MVRFVTPVQRDQMTRQFAYPFRVTQDDVAPEQDSPSARCCFALDLFEEVDIDAAFAFGGAELFALAEAEIPGFVAADIKVCAGKIREQFIVESAQEGKRAGMIR